MADAPTSFVMMSVGEFRFGIDTAAFQDLSRSNSWRWPTVDRIGARPAVQYVGPGDDSITLSGIIYPHFRGGLGQIEAMRAEASKGEPLMVVDGAGRVWGKFVIVDLREGAKTFWSNGAPRSQDFEINLQAYGGEEEPAPGLAFAAVPELATPSAESVIATFDGADPEALAARVATKSVVGDAAVRRVFGVSTEGVARLTSAISVAGSVMGTVEGTVSGVKRAATAVPSAIGALFSSPSLATFAAFGRDLDALVREASTGSGGALDAVLDTINEVGAADIIPRLFSDADQRAAVTALAEVRANG